MTHRSMPCLLLFGLLGVYLITLSPTVHWLDSSALTAAAFQLAGAHPPGEAAYILLTHPFTRLPLGDIAQRASLASALALAGAGAVQFMLAAWLLRTGSTRVGHRQADAGTRPDRLRSWGLPLLMALAPCLSWPLWIQAVRAEVYALSLLLTLGMIGCGARAGLIPGGVAFWKDTAHPRTSNIDVRWLLVAALLGGLNLGVHPLLAGLAGIPLALALLLALPKTLYPARTLVLATLAGTLGYSSNLFLVLRAIANPEVGWGDATTLQGFLDLLLARTFQQNFSPFTSDVLLQNLHLMLEVMAGTAGPLLLALAGLGAALTLWRSPSMAAFVLGLLGCNLLSVVLQNKVLPDNPDLHGYLQLSHICLWWLAGLAVTHALDQLEVRATPESPLRRLHRWIPVLGAGLLGTQALTSTLLSYEGANRSGDDLARRHAMAAFIGLPPGAWLVSSGNDTLFLLDYLQRIEGKRPDVLHLPRTLLTHPWFHRRQLRLNADLSEPVLVASQSASELLRLPSLPAVRLEAREIDLDRSNHLCPTPTPGWGYYTLRAEAWTVAPGTVAPGTVAPGTVDACLRANAALGAPVGAAAPQTPSPASESPALEVRPGGLLQFPSVRRGPEALSVGLLAHHLLLQWYVATHQEAAAQLLRAQLHRLFPEIDLR